MTPEAPQGVETQSGNEQAELLQQELAKLSDFERTELQSFLEEERGKIMYITTQELGELQSIIENGGNHHRDRHEIIQEFLEDQISEGLSSSDILAGMEGENILNAEILDALDAESYTILFGSDGLFSGFEISPTAQDHVSVSLTLALIDSLQSNPTELQSIIAGLPDIDLGEQMNQLLGQRFTELSGALANNLDIGDILGDGEKNAVFMNTQIGKEFFLGVLNGTTERTEMISELMSHGGTEILSPNIGNIGEIPSLSPEELRTLLTVGDIDNPIDDDGNTDSTVLDDDGNIVNPVASEVEAVVDRFARLRESKPLGAFLASILEFLEGLSATFGTAEATAENIEATETEAASTPEVTPTTPPLMTALSNLDSRQLGNINKEALLLSLADSATQTRITTLLENMIPGVSLEDTLTHLFTGEADTFSKFRDKLVEAGYPALTSEAGESTAIQQFSSILEEYTRYRQSDGVQGRAGGRTLWDDYIAARSVENWATA